MIQPGAIVTVRQTGSARWVAKRREPDGRWRVISKATDGRGRQRFSARIAGEGDLELVTDAPIFAVGASVTVNGREATVLEDRGETVTVFVPEKNYPHPTGVSLRVPASQADADKSDIVLEVMT
jgi:hypothetical protein